MIELLEIKDFLSPATNGDLRAELHSAAGRDATVSGRRTEHAVEALVRATTRLTLPPPIRDLVHQSLLSRMEEIGRHFGVGLTQCEAPQFLRYERGNFFVAHQDGNTPLIHDDTRFRKVSTVIFLSAHSEEPLPDTYGGGKLVFHGPYSELDLRVPVAPAPGTLIAFRSETTHEVTPVTHGERYTIVSWFR
jgi:predicted 2-oxoglutarate/Fe(II)-dependent dioxygenase YbiX